MDRNVLNMLGGDSSRYFAISNNGVTSNGGNVVYGTQHNATNGSWINSNNNGLGGMPLNPRGRNSANPNSPNRINGATVHRSQW